MTSRSACPGPTAGAAIPAGSGRCRSHSTACSCWCCGRSSGHCSLLSQAEALRELLHDADEGLLSYDPISPVKPHLGEDFRALATSLQAAVRTRYSVAAWDDENYAVHKQADRLAAASEAVHVAGWSYAELRETLEIDIPPLSADPLPLLEGMQPWEPWPARTAAALFLSKLRELTADNDEGGGVTADLAGCIARTRTLAFLAEAFMDGGPSLTPRLIRAISVVTAIR